MAHLLFGSNSFIQSKLSALPLRDLPAVYGMFYSDNALPHEQYQQLHWDQLLELAAGGNSAALWAIEIIIRMHEKSWEQADRLRRVRTVLDE